MPKRRFIMPRSTITARTLAGGVLSIVSASAALALPPAQEWLRQYTGPAGFFNVGKAVVTDAAGNIYVTGESATGFGGGIATIKYDAAGNQLWAARLQDGITDTNRPADIQITPDGNILVGGFRSGAGNFGDYVLVKYNAATGAVIFDTRINGAGNNLDGLSAFVQDAAGNIYATGQSWSGVDYDYLTVKLSPVGAELWRASRDGVEGGPDGINDAGVGVAVDAAGNVFVTGWVQIGYDSGEEINLYGYGTVKYNNAGVEQWFSVYGGSGVTGQAAGVVVGADGNPIVTGAGSAGAVTIKYDSASGTALWTNAYNGPAGSGATPYAMSIQSNGNPVMAGGVCQGAPFCGEAAGVWSLDTATGALAWQNVYADPNPAAAGSSARGLFVASDNTVYLAGFSQYLSGVVRGQAIAAAFSPNGSTLWVDNFSPGNAYLAGGTAITRSAAGNVILHGTRTSAPGTSFFMTVKYAAPCAADFNRDGTLDFFDYLDFVAAFDAELPSADFNGDNTIDFFDYLDFVAAFDAGCD
jgi:hypothetical protein